MAATRPARKIQGAAKRIPEFVSFQLCQLRPEPPNFGPWIHEIKFDGYRVQVRVVDGEAQLRTRNGYDWTDRFPGLMATAGRLPDCMIDAELCALGPDGYSHFSDLRSALARGKTEDLVLFAFDAMFRGSAPVAEDLRPYDLATRKQVLRQILDAGGEAVAGRIRYVDPLPAGDPAALVQAACRLNWEGIVSKRLDESYNGRKDGTWVKTKCRPSVDVVVGGWRTEGSRFRSLIAGVRERDGRLRYAGRIHTGYSADVTRDLVRKLKPLEVDHAPFDLGEVPAKTSDIHWVRPELIAEVEMAEFTASGKLRQASFKGLREDLS